MTAPKVAGPVRPMCAAIGQHILAPLDARCVHCGKDMSDVDTRETNCFGTRIERGDFVGQYLRSLAASKGVQS